MNNKLEANNYKSWVLTDRQICDLELIIDGSFNPLNGFLNESDYNNVLDNMKLSDGSIWPIPIILDVNDKFISTIEDTGSITLRDKEGFAIAILDIESKWKPNKENEVLKNSGITSDYLVFQQFFAYKNLNQLDEAKLALEKLIDNQYENPIIYNLISDIYLSENDEANALRYIALGRERFSQDQSLVDSEINLYITLGRTDELIENLSASIASYPDNVSYYVIRGTCYQNSNKLQEAILDYKSALNINPDHLTALNNISACYLSMTEPIITKLNALS